MDITQFVIIVTTVTLAALLVILGIQVYHILGEFRRSLSKINKMLDDGTRVTGTVSDSVTNISGFMSGIKSGISAVASFKHHKEEDYG